MWGGYPPGSLVLVTIVLLVVTTAFLVQADSACTRRHGKCQWNWKPCTSTYTSGLCHGARRRQCCIPNGSSSPGDAKCLARNGKCQHDRDDPCSGSYQSGLCAGSVRRRCCVPKGSSGNGRCPNVRIISRRQWGARTAKRFKRIRVPVRRFFIHHTTGASCSDVRSCSAAARRHQNYHMDRRRYSDIGYSFLIGEDGNVYEGRGWGRVGAHTKGYNAVSFAAAFIGTFTKRVPNDKALKAAKNLIACGVKLGKISGRYRLYGHRDVAKTECPGQAMYRLIQTWPHY